MNNFTTSLTGLLKIIALSREGEKIALRYSTNINIPQHLRKDGLKSLQFYRNILANAEGGTHVSY